MRSEDLLRELRNLKKCLMDAVPKSYFKKQNRYNKTSKIKRKKCF